MTKRHTLDQRHVTARQAFRLYSTWARFGWDMLGRDMDVTRKTGERMSEILALGLLGGWAPKSMAKELAQEYSNLVLDMLAAPSAAFNSAVAEYDKPDPDAAKPIERALTGAAPPTLAAPLTLGPSENKEQQADEAPRAQHFLLPARILDSSQAWASWFIPLAKAEALMQEAVDLGYQPAEVLDAFEPVSVGPGKAMVSLLATDYRASDFGELEELGLTLSVTPKGQKVADPGQMFIRLIVSDPYSIDAAKKIWGICKDPQTDPTKLSLMPSIDAAYSEDAVRFVVGRQRAKTLEIEFPRFGTGRSNDAPSLVYSMAEPAELPKRPTAPVRSVLRRSSEGEGFQFGGAVKLCLPDNQKAGKDAGCLCSNGMACLCDTLRALELDQNPPAANGWSELMTGALEGPAPIEPVIKISGTSD